MTERARSYAFMLAGFSAMLGANLYFGDTIAGAAAVFAGVALYIYGWRGVCPACQAGRCDVRPPAADRSN